MSVWGGEGMITAGISKKKERDNERCSVKALEFSL